MISKLGSPAKPLDPPAVLKTESKLLLPEDKDEEIYSIYTFTHLFIIVKVYFVHNEGTIDTNMDQVYERMNKHKNVIIYNFYSI